MSSRSALSRFVLLAALTAGYFIAGRLGLAMASVHPSASAVWPPSGLALAALILGGYRLWPAIGLGAFLVNLTTSGATIPSLAIACGNTLEALLGAWLVDRFAGGTLAFHSGRGVTRFAFAAAASALPAATIGAAALVLTSLASPAQFGPIWLTWWLGDFTGILIAAPLVVLWMGQPLRRWTAAQTLEAFAQVLALGVVGHLLFVGPLSQRPLGFVVLPVLVWSALRFGPRGAATTTAALSAMAVAATVRGAGVFADSGPHESLLLVQAFTAVAGLTSLLLAAVVEERERTKETLRGSEARYQAIAEAAPVFLFANRPDGGCDYVSPQFYEYTGAPPGAALGDGWLGFVHPEDRETTLATFLEARRAGKPHELDQRLIGKDGSARWFRVRNVPQRDAGGAVEKWIGVCVDIHERREMEAERDRLLTASEQARNEAERASRAKDEFLAMLGHELRNPLGAVHNALLASRLDPSSRERGLEIAWRQVEQLMRLVDDLLDVARVSEGKIPIRSEQVRLAAVIEQALDATRPVFEAHGHPPPTVVLPPEAVDVLGDPARLQQVVANLLNNAAKFTPPGRPIEIALERRGSDAAVRVRDAGIGIPAELLGRVFDPFVQGQSGLDRSQGGLGIGLTLVRRIVELHGGRVEAKSEGSGRGTELVVTIPAQPPTQLAERAERVTSLEPRSAIRALIVEDNVDAAEALATLLRLLGHEVEVHCDGASGLEAARRNPPDLVLLDIGLPGMDGYEVASRLRAEPATKGIRIVALSGYGRQQDRSRSLEAGFDGHLVKPIDLETLQAVLSRPGRPVAVTLH